MFRRFRGPQPPARVSELSKSHDETSGRRAEANGREPRRLPEYCWWDGWGWYYGELVCPLSWLLMLDRKHDQHPEQRCEED